MKHFILITSACLLSAPAFAGNALSALGSPSVRAPIAAVSAASTAAPRSSSLATNFSGGDGGHGGHGGGGGGGHGGNGGNGGGHGGDCGCDSLPGLIDADVLVEDVNVLVKNVHTHVHHIANIRIGK